MTPAQVSEAMHALADQVNDPRLFENYDVDSQNVMERKHQYAKARAGITAASPEVIVVSDSESDGEPPPAKKRPRDDELEEAPVPEFVTKQSPEQLQVSLASVGIFKDVTEANLVESQREYIEEIATRSDLSGSDTDSDVDWVAELGRKRSRKEDGEAGRKRAKRTDWVIELGSSSDSD